MRIGGGGVTPIIPPVRVLPKTEIRTEACQKPDWSIKTWRQAGVWDYSIQSPHGVFPGAGGYGTYGIAKARARSRVNVIA